MKFIVLTREMVENLKPGSLITHSNADGMLGNDIDIIINVKILHTHRVRFEVFSLNRMALEYVNYRELPDDPQLKDFRYFLIT